MKATLRLLALAMILAISQTVFAQTPITISGDITSNTTWTGNNIYLLQGFVYVRSGATLTIQAGTLIKGDKPTKGTLIVERGAKIIADGNAQQPIVFTSNQQPGRRNYGDWGGVIICGQATQNQPGSPTIEGGVGSQFGGTNDADDSGILRYVRIEFAGIALTPGNEINGLTLGAVGSATQIDHVQVSYSGDDAFEWFGGTVNAKYLIAFRSWDDDFDTDFGYRGNVQFGIALRDPKIADQSRSNIFESDNDATGSQNSPFTAPTFSNISGFVTPGPDTLNRLFGRSMHIRRNSRISIFNSVFTGFNTGLYLDGTACEANVSNGAIELNNNFLHARRSAGLLQVVSTPSFLSTLKTWFTTGRGNDTSSVVPAVAVTALGINANLFDLSNPDFSLTSAGALAGGAAFTSNRLSGGFFTTTSYRGAIAPNAANDWTTGWTNWDPQNTDYTSPLSVAKPLTVKPLQTYPNPVTGLLNLTAEVAYAQNVEVLVTDVQGKTMVSSSKALEAGQNLIQIDTERLPNGIYTIRLVNGQASTSQRFVVTR